MQFPFLSLFFGQMKKIKLFQGAVAKQKVQIDSWTLKVEKKERHFTSFSNPFFFA